MRDRIRPLALVSRRSLLMAFALAALLVVGRLTRLPESQVSLFWPSAGVAVWWFVGQPTRAAWAVDAALLLVVVFGVNLETGAPAAVAAAYAGINLVHAVVGASTLKRFGILTSGVRTSAGPPLLLAASAAAGVVSGLLTAVVSATVLGEDYLSVLVLVAVRNTSGTFLILLLVFALRGPAGARELVAAPRVGESAVAFVCGLVIYWLVFDAQPSLPLGFAVLPLWVWVGWRLGLARTSVLSLVLGGFAVYLTMQGHGVFADIESATTSATVVQAFLLVTVLTSASLAASQEDRARIASELVVARSTLAESIDVSLIGNSVLVTGGDHAGDLIHPNPALRRLLRTDWPLARQGDAEDAGAADASWFRFLREEDRTAAHEVLREMAAGTRSDWVGELAHRLADGSVVWAQVHLSMLSSQNGATSDSDGWPASELIPDDAAIDGRASLAVAQFLDVTARKDAEAKLTHLALHDDLTGLPNRLLLGDRIDLALAAARRTRTQVGLIFLDLDEFKAVNDAMGHGAGDSVLMMVAQRLRGAVRPADTVSRIGGDEFVVCCPDLSTPDEAEELARRLVSAVSMPVLVGERWVPVGVSAGVTVSRRGDDAAALLKQSDSAMYAAKRSGRGRVESFTQDLEAMASRHLTLTSGLQEALERDEFVLHYQPLVDITTGIVTGCEALVRWQHPTRGLLAPGEWLDVAEQSDVVIRLGGWVLKRACRDMAAVAESNRPLKVHINVSGRQLSQAGLVEQVVEALAECGLPAHLVVLELTETHLLEVHDSMLADLMRVRALGVELAIDDFGTGFSSLTQLVRLPLDAVKIDRSFVIGADGDPRAFAVIRGILGMAAALGLNVVAEGIETPAQAAMLESLGCPTGQGYLWSPPVDLAHFHELVLAGDAASALKAARQPDAP
jgi:diguanylate cyclase (GGDEF)-like protein